jgi:hypothetical protein
LSIRRWAPGYFFICFARRGAVAFLCAAPAVLASRLSSNEPKQRAARLSVDSTDIGRAIDCYVGKSIAMLLSVGALALWYGFERRSANEARRQENLLDEAKALQRSLPECAQGRRTRRRKEDKAA